MPSPPHGPMVSEWNSVYKKKGGVSNSPLQRKQKMREVARIFGLRRGDSTRNRYISPRQYGGNTPIIGTTGGMRGGRRAQFMISKKRPAKENASPR
jgi:hypothetical protein